MIEKETEFTEDELERIERLFKEVNNGKEPLEEEEYEKRKEALKTEHIGQLILGVRSVGLLDFTDSIYLKMKKEWKETDRSITEN